MGRAFTILIFDLICIELPIDVSSQMSNAANKESTVQMIHIVSTTVLLFLTMSTKVMILDRVTAL